MLIFGFCYCLSTSAYIHKVSNLSNENIAVKIEYAGGGRSFAHANHGAVIRPGEAVRTFQSDGYCLSKITVRSGNDVGIFAPQESAHCTGTGRRFIPIECINPTISGGKIILSKIITGITCKGIGIKVLPGGIVKLKSYPSDKWMMEKK
jgi:hypothetical protein